MVPWIIVYAFNVLGYFVASIFIFYQCEGASKAFGVIPLVMACLLVVCHFAVMYFAIEQRSDYLSGACNNIINSGASSPT